MEESLVNRLKTKINLLISMYEEAASENERLEKKLFETTEQLTNSNNKVKELEQQLDNLQLREAFKSSSQDVAQAKAKITFLIKEIDKCIELINNSNES